MEWLVTLVEFLKSATWPLRIVQAWEGAIHLRLGRYKRTLTPGWWLIVPALDRVWDASLLTEPTDIGPLVLTTHDGLSVTVAAVVTWEVADVKRYLLGCSDPREALHDAASGTLAHAVLGADWANIPTEPFIAAVCTQVRKSCHRYGIRVLRMQWTGIAQCRPMVVWNVAGGGVVATPTLAGKGEG